MHVQTGKGESFVKFCTIHITVNTKSSLLNNPNEKCVYAARLPQQLYQQRSPAPMMRFALPTSPKAQMRNDDIKERWKYLNLTIKTQWLGQRAKAAI